LEVGWKRNVEGKDYYLNLLKDKLISLFIIFVILAHGLIYNLIDFLYFLSHKVDWFDFREVRLIFGRANIAGTCRHIHTMNIEVASAIKQHLALVARRDYVAGIYFDRANSLRESTLNT